MSVVTNLILCTASQERDSIDALNATLEGAPFLEIPSHVEGGDKHVEASIYIGAFNYFDIPAFVDKLLGLQWECPERVQLFVSVENAEERFHEVPLRGPRAE